MLDFVGNLSLPLLVTCILSAIYPAVSYLSFTLSKIITYVIFCFATLAMGLLIYVHITDNFSFCNVYYNSHTTKPLIYKICGVWGNYEGSILLWLWILSVHALLLELLLKSEDLKKVAISIQHLLYCGFSLFIMTTSNPFTKMTTVELDGLGFNPMLQDIGLAIHPPILFFGYVGFSTVFSITLSSVMVRKRAQEWACIISPWVLTSWSFLTCGIALGSWWAYRELGWGGFWFWDPVENSSLMPWLLGVALIHAITLVRKFNICCSFAYVLSIFTFGFSLIGTFLVRSGILVSVHTFANDPERGIYILLLIGVIISTSVVILMIFFRGSKENYCFSYISKITAIMINNILLLTAFFVVFIGTIYPIILELLTDEVISVGSQYYNIIFGGLVVVLLLLMGFVWELDWQESNNSKISFKLYLLIILTIFSLILFKGIAAGILLLSILLIVLSLKDYSSKIQLFRIPLTSSIKLAISLHTKYYSMFISHMGFSILVLGIICSTVLQETKEQYMKANSRVNIYGLEIVLSKLTFIKKDNYEAIRGLFVIKDNDRIIGKLLPENRFYIVEGTRNTESSIYHNGLSDIYIIIGDIDVHKGIAVKIYYKPYVNLVWIGFFMIAFGGIIGVILLKRRLYNKLINRLED
ncbi:heme lyase CcmF/NrfE family subunit [Neoehrlichia mikurensis]|uniref:Heme lyase CcmF/NrfE family subunit n=1 Tax=Neoehrlichia mikurensis TaxID=89586 RepID=A0A9Q9BTV9_9RICK|nr:heme lyase CcmF/NrfE family subunit [Neoehrlichia mikurensis]QXK92256.1 heme lyase CcmF/NrfE family subunit [Neoehrlichia mikurensis]QXK92710.1 heme lyase CcmF/NrfE family subunit [Neoehrlichia mikurensis]QXK93948.1 heme lyase CcmF/NrfE family subunit [Neoehrlichia mikurensis]UTO55887.1 heme lyase CcmF/NrfE family subunit [Neoehrlichia mikurensis]UTO56803.1 heme lyase CcmF/NrfE family subunit [Neoehrlichia mikurensis]